MHSSRYLYSLLTVTRVHCCVWCRCSSTVLGPSNVRGRRNGPSATPVRCRDSHPNLLRTPTFCVCANRKPSVRAPYATTVIDSPSSLNRWDLGLVVPDLHLNLTLHGFVSAAELFCASREKDLRELRARVGSYNFTRRLALRQSTHCDAFWSAAARDFDVILANPTGVGALARSSRGRNTGRP